MSGRGADPSAASYSPQRRTALLLTGTGTAGAYHAGVLRALHEAGVKLDVAAGRGIGVVGALFTAVDGAPHLWSDKGFWKDPKVGALYGWRPTLRVLGVALLLAVAVVALPIAAMALGLIVYPIDFVLKMLGLSGGGLVGWYVGVANAAFAPTALPTWLPRLAVLILGACGLTAALSALRRTSTRHARGPWWWRVVPAPLTADAAIAHAWGAVWDLVRGAAQLRLPNRTDLARRYTELLAENIGQPGFRELLIVAHDVDAGRDLVFALVADDRRRDLVRRPLTQAAEERRAELFDLAGVARDHLADAVAAALTVPLATDLHDVHFSPDAYWRGETHRLCDRAGGLERLLRRTGRARRRADHRGVGSAGVAGAARPGLAAARWSWPARRVRALGRGRRAARRAGPPPRRRPGCVRHPTIAQPCRAVRLRRRLRRSIGPPIEPHRTHEPRLRRCLSPVHRAGGGCQW